MMGSSYMLPNSITVHEKCAANALWGGIFSIRRYYLFATNLICKLSDDDADTVCGVGTPYIYTCAPAHARRKPTSPYGAQLRVKSEELRVKS